MLGQDVDLEAGTVRISVQVTRTAIVAQGQSEVALSFELTA